MFVSIKPLHVSVFFHDHPQGVLLCALYRYSSSRWFAFVEFVELNQRKSAGRIVTAQSTAEDPLGMVVEKDRNMSGFYTYKHAFNILLVLNVEVIVFWSVYSAWVELYNKCMQYVSAEN